MCSEYYEFGRKYFGPFLFGFTKWLDKEICNQKFRKIFFFSRDGYMMKKAFDQISPLSNKSEYVYFSRKSIRQALLYRCNSYIDSLQYMSKEKYISLGKILEYYGFSENERMVLANEYNLNLYKEYRFNELESSTELSNLYQSLKPEIDQMSLRQSELLLKYINQIDMKGNCAIVDIGWHGSMQYYLEKLCSENSWPIHLCGYYVGILPNVPILGDVNGFLYDESHKNLRKSVLCFFGIMEKLFQSLEGSTYGYKSEKGKIVPILNTYEFSENENIKNAIIQWQKAAIDYINEKNNSVDRDIDFWNYAIPLIKFGKSPSFKEVKLFSSFYNTDGIKEFYVSQKGLFQYTPKGLLYELCNSVWKTGFMKSVFKIPLPYYWVYCLLKK